MGKRQQQEAARVQASELAAAQEAAASVTSELEAMVREVEARAHELAVVVQQQLAALAEKNQSLLNSVQQLRRLQVRSPEQEAAASAASKLEAMVREVEARAHELAVVVQQQLAALSVEHEQSQQARQSLLN